MNTLRKVMNKVTSIEKEEVQLESHKVELGLVDEIKKEYAKYSKSQINGNSKTNAVVDSAKQAISLYQQAIKDYGLIVQQINYIKKQATDLGVDVPPSIKSLETEVNSGLSFMNDRIKKLNIATQVASK